MVELFYLVLSCYNMQKLSHCLWWRQTDITTDAWTVLTRDLLPNLTTEAKIFVLWAVTIKMDGVHNTKCQTTTGQKLTSFTLKSTAT
jgi:hypothetical protein